MKRVEFITIEDEEDLIVSFGIAPAAQHSLTLLRSPQFEFLLPDEERGVTVSFDPREQERDLLREIQWHDTAVTIKTDRHEYKLDIADVEDSELIEAKAVLRKMVSDGVARMEGA